MTKTSQPQYVHLDQPFGCDPPLAHCPICGNPSMVVDKIEGGKVTPCDHLAFIFVGEVDAFEYESKDFKKRTAGINKETLSVSNFKSALKKAGYTNNMLALEITGSGMACGPVSSSVIFGFDYDFMARPE
jgi:hypothetical protein